MDAGVVERFATGDPDAVREVYAVYGRLVFAIALRVLGNRSLAEEATQQTFVQAWRGASSFDVTRDIGPWLSTIARRVAIDVHRREARRPTTPIDDAPVADRALVSLPPSVEQTEAIWQVREAIERLPTDEQQIIRLQHLDQLTHVEIAERLSMPIGTVKSRSFRAHKSLAARLGHLRSGTPDDEPSPDGRRTPRRPS